jgi:hypothetical protein
MEKEILKRNKVVLLEGPTTIRGQIKARNKGLYHCLQPNTDRIYPNTRKAWIENHIEVLKKLYALAKRHGIKTTK